MDKWINFGKILSPLATLFSVATVLITVFGFFYKKVIKNKRKKKEVKQSVKVPMAEISPEVMEELDEDDEIIPPYQGDEEDEDVYDDPYITQKKVNKFYISLAILTTICLLTTISELIINLFVDYNVFNLVIFWIKIILSSISIILIIVITIMLILLLLKFYPKDDGETINIYLFYFYWFMIIGIIGSIILSVLIFVIDQNVLLKVNLGLISGLIALYFLLILIINHHLGSINKIFKFRGSILCLAVGLRGVGSLSP